MNGAILAICFLLAMFIGWNFTALTDISNSLKNIEKYIKESE